MENIQHLWIIHGLSQYDWYTDKTIQFQIGVFYQKVSGKPPENTHRKINRKKGENTKKFNFAIHYEEKQFWKLLSYTWFFLTLQIIPYIINVRYSDRRWFNTPVRVAMRWPQPSMYPITRSTCTLHVTLCTKCEF